MSDVSNAAAPADGALSISDAARMLANSRREKQATPDMPEPEREEPAADDPVESSEPYEGEDAAPEEQVRGADAEEPDPAEAPSIEPPRSWTKEDKEIFRNLPPETQARLAERDRKRETEFLRSQNEAAELKRSFDARVQAAEQVRQQYEAALPRVAQVLVGQHAEQFGDIQSIADLARMQREDPLRFQEYQISERKVIAAHQEMQAAQQRQAAEWGARWEAFTAEQDKLFLERAPEFADPQKAPKAIEQARRYLTDVGLSEGEIDDLWSGRSGVPLRDHRIQLIIRDAMRYRAAQTAVKSAQPKPVPPVQRPGTAPPRGGPSSEIQALEKAFQRNPTAKNAAALTAAKRRAAAARSR